MPAQKKAVCFSCSQQCGHIAYIENGQVIQLSGDREHPRTSGYICPKGARAHKMHYRADRVHHPLKRVGSRGSGQWQTVTWDDALKDISDRLSAIKNEYGAESIAHGFGTVHGADFGIGKRFMNLLGSPNSVGQDKICMGPTALGEFLTYGFGPTTYTQPIGGVTKCLVLWGRRPNHSGRPAWKAMKSAITQGTSLLVIDPEYTTEAKQADLWLQIKPGTDAVLGMGLLHLIIEREYYDREVVANQSIGFDELKSRVAKYSPDTTAAITGIPADKIEAAAEMIKCSSPTVFGAGNGLCQSGTSAVQQGRIVACLIALTGNLNREGGHPLLGPPRDLLSNGSGLKSEVLSVQQRAKTLGAESFHCIGSGYEQLDSAISKAWHGIKGTADWLNSAHEPTLWQAILNERPYPIKALLLQYHNPVGGSANVAQVEAALRSDNLDLLVSHDMFVNGSSRFADYILPATHWLEKPYFSFGLASIAFSGDYVEAGHAVIEPEYDHRSDYDLWRDLGRLMGQQVHWPEKVEDYYQSLLDPAELLFSELANSNAVLVGQDAQNPNLKPPEPNSLFGTVSGKIEFKSLLLAMWGEDPLPKFTPPAAFNVSDEYPLILTTGGRHVEGFHQNAQQVDVFRKKNPEPFVSIHPDTAARMSVEEGQWVRIETVVGNVSQQVKLNANLPLDTLHADRWWYPEGIDDESDPFGVRATNINMCTSNEESDMDPIMGSWLLRGLACRIC